MRKPRRGLGRTHVSLPLESNWEDRVEPLPDAQTVVGFVGTLLAMALYGLVHSLLASQSVKRAFRDAFGERTDRWYRPTYNLVAVVTLVPILALPVLLPGRHLYTISTPWLWLTLTLQGIAAIALLAGLLQTDLAHFLGVTQLLGRTPRQDDLVTDGLYQWVRHPLYTAGLVIIWLVPRMTTSLLALNLGITAYLYIGSIFEERKLVDEYGDEYERYRRSVPRMVPRPWRSYSDDS